MYVVTLKSTLERVMLSNIVSDIAQPDSYKLTSSAYKSNVALINLTVVASSCWLALAPISSSKEE